MVKTNVTFDSVGIPLAGHLYVPDTPAQAPRPAIVVGHPGGGLPRGLEDPAHRVEDLKAAVSFLTTRGEVDSGRIGAVGICAPGGYVLPATASDHRVQAVATVSAVDIARQFRLGADGTQAPAAVQSMPAAAADARTTEARCALGGAHGAEGFAYYRTPRARHPSSAPEPSRPG